MSSNGTHKIKPRVEAVEVRGQTVYVRGLGVKRRRDAFRKSFEVKEDGKLVSKDGFGLDAVDMLIGGVCDEEGALLYTEADADEVGGWDYEVAEALLVKISELSGLTMAAKNEIEKNS